MASQLNPNAAAFVPTFLPTTGESTEKDGAKKSGTKKNRRNKRRDKKEGRRNVGHSANNRKGSSSRRPPRRGRRKNDDRAMIETKNIGNDQGSPDSKDGTLLGAFPPLSEQHPPIGEGRPGMPLKEWSNVAHLGHKAWKREDQRRRMEERLQKDTPVFARLIPLSAPQRETPICDKSESTEESLPGLELSDEVGYTSKSLTVQAIHQTRVSNMNKMRGRWWALLRQKRMRDAEDAKRRAQQEEEKATDYEATQMSENVVSSVEHDRSEESGDETDSISEQALAFGEYPLHKAVIIDNEPAIRRLLSPPFGPGMVARAPLQVVYPSSTDALRSKQLFSPLHLAVYLDRPHLVKILVSSHSSGKQKGGNDELPSPLMLAAELGHDSCIEVLLDYNSGYSALMAKEAKQGNTALHFACRQDVSTLAVRQLLHAANDSGQSQKVLLTRNHQGQTALHIACESGLDHLVGTFLQVCSTALVTKLLRVKDNQQQTPLLSAVAVEATDVVMAILMWSGYHEVVRNTKTSEVSLSPSECPLVWAVTVGSLEMVHLLLEFDSGEYCVDVALQESIRSPHEARDELVRVLIEAGANPCAEVSYSPESPSKSSFTIAVELGAENSLQLIVDAYRKQLRERQTSRRQDPKLQKQPAMYFRGIESTENGELSVSLNDALVRALFLGRHDNHVSSACLSCALLLFKKGVRLKDSGFSRLKCSIKTSVLHSNEVAPEETSAIYASSYTHPTDRTTSTVYRRKNLKYWSNRMMAEDWKPDVDIGGCGWLLAGEASPTNGGKENDTVTLVAKGGRFQVDAQLLSRKSDKLGAAIRFARMKTTESEDSPEVQVAISAKHCRWLLQHIYHGSIVDSFGPADCHELLQLSMIAHEFLCPTLLQECAMRLLSRDASKCFCWSCCTSVRQLDHETGECLNCFSGPSSLLRADNALDALAVAQELERAEENTLLVENSSNGTHEEYNPWKKFEKDSTVFFKPFKAVKDASVRTMLLDFASVVKSPPFESHVNTMVAESQKDIRCLEREAQILLLAMCLDEVASMVD